MTASFPIWLPYQQSAEEITAFDSTGLAIHDLALAVLERVEELEGGLELSP